MAERARRMVMLAVLGGVAAGGAMLLAASRAWAELTLSTPAAPRDVVSVTGAEAVPLTAALALVVLAGSVAVLPTTGWLRRGIGGVVAAAALIGLVVAAGAGEMVRAALRANLLGSPASAAGNVPTAADVDVSWWRWVAVLAAVGGIATGLMTARWGHTWAVMGRRYDAPSTDLGDADDADQWRALDAGRDPTQ